MSDTPYQRKRDFFGAVSGEYRVLASSTGLIPLVPTIPQHTIFIQTIHIEVTTPTAAEAWTFQDGAGVPLTRPVSAAAVAHFDFDFGPDGVPCSEATAFVLNITGAIGAVGWITWEAYKTLPLAAPRFASVILADQPFGYWRLGDAVGSGVAIDSSGHGFNGTVVGGVTFGQPGVLADGSNAAAAFDGVTASGVQIAAFPIPALFTIEAWVKRNGDQSPGAFSRIWASGPAVTFPFELGINNIGGGQNRISYFINFTDLTPGWTDIGYQPLADATYYDIAATWDGIAVRVYVNSVLAYSNTAWAGKTLISIGSTSGVRVIGDGGPGAGGSAFKGTIDEVALYTYALTPAQIAKHFNAATVR
jgi:hypothetical protein